MSELEKQIDGQQTLTPLLDKDAWAKLSPRDIEALITQVLRIIGNEFVYLGARIYSSGLYIPTFKHLKSDIEFNLIPGGEYQMGLSNQESSDARLISGCREDLLQGLSSSKFVRVDPFLMSRYPLPEQFVRQQIQLNPMLFRPDFSGGDTSKLIPVYLTRTEVETVIRPMGFLLPTEVQWEYAARGGTTSLFYFGSALPGNDTLESKILLTGFQPNLLDDIDKANPFGLMGMFTGSWCQDKFQPTSGGQSEGLNDVSGPFAIRGGGAIFWPWQDLGEWMLCMSAMRMSSDDVEDGTCSAQVVVPIPQLSGYGCRS